MTKYTKNTLFKASSPRAETLMDKITRAAKEIIDDETEQRALKTARLRKARLEREACTPAQPPKATSRNARKAPRAKAAKKS
ncbi:MAG: hypothetical protein ACP5DC_10240 [Halothiobacillaceae bacterium]|jgi:hypothetical protein